MKSIATSIITGALLLISAFVLMGCAAPVANVPGAVPTDPASPLAVTVVARPSSLKLGDPVSLTVTVKNVSGAELVLEGWAPDRPIIPDYETFSFWVTVFDPEGHPATLDNWVNTGPFLWVTFDPVPAGQSVETTQELTRVYVFEAPGRYGLQVKFVSDTKRAQEFGAWGGEAYSAPIWIDVAAP